MSTRSVCRRFKLASTARVTWRRELPLALMSGPEALKHLVATTRSSRLPRISLPRISSDLPLLYWSAVSKKLTPRSRTALNISAEAASSASPPKGMVPKHSWETCTPVRPSVRNFMRASLSGPLPTDSCTRIAHAMLLEDCAKGLQPRAGFPFVFRGRDRIARHAAACGARARPALGQLEALDRVRRPGDGPGHLVDAFRRHARPAPAHPGAVRPASDRA